MEFSFQIDQSQTPPVLILSGNIDERADFSLIELPATVSLAIDLNGIGLVNSLGLRKWIQWINGLQSQSFFLRRCPPAVVNQMNILYGFVPPGAVIESFYIPFYCTECNYEENVLAKRGTDFLESVGNKDVQIKIPLEQKCPDCAKPFCADILPIRYFRFLRSTFLNVG